MNFPAADPHTSDSPYELLVVDDDPIARTLVARFLGRQPLFRVQTASDGVSALACLGTARRPLDLLLTDIQMPGMDGFTLIRAARQIDASIRVAVMSGGGYPPEWREHMRTLPLGFALSKPFTPDALLQAVWLCLDADAERPRAAAPRLSWCGAGEL